MAKSAAEILADMRDRLEELAPFVTEYVRLEAALAAMPGAEPVPIQQTKGRPTMDEELLKHLQGRGPLKVAELAKLAHRSPSSVHRSLLRMRKSGKVRSNGISKRWEIA